MKQEINKNKIKKNKINKIVAVLLIVLLLLMSLVACENRSGSSETHSLETSNTESDTTGSDSTETDNIESDNEESDTATSSQAESEVNTDGNNGAEDHAGEETITAIANITTDGAIDAGAIFTERDLRQTVDTSEAKYVTLQSGNDVSITEEGIYVLSGEASDVTVSVDVLSDKKVQLVLDSVTITNANIPCIYVKNADKVFVTTTDSGNTLTVTGNFMADGETNTDAVIFSKDDVVLNGLGTLNISSTDNGITSKDDLKITGGTINIDCTSDALEANDSIAVSGGNINIKTPKDGFHAEKDDDDTKGYIYICGGNITIQAGDDGIHGTTIIQIDGGTINIDAHEGIEATYIQINDGEINISASDDGINASRKSTAYDILAEFNGGYIKVAMGQGDTDAIDSNGNLYVNGGTLDLYAQSPFDYDGIAEYNGGTIIVNGQTVNTITNQFMGGGMGGPQGFNQGGPGGSPEGEGGSGYYPGGGGFPGEGGFPGGGGFPGEGGPGGRR